VFVQLHVSSVRVIVCVVLVLLYFVVGLRSSLC
jgi:hypothetical protein